MIGLTSVSLEKRTLPTGMMAGGGALEGPAGPAGIAVGRTRLCTGSVRRGGTSTGAGAGWSDAFGRFCLGVYGTIGVGCTPAGIFGTFVGTVDVDRLGWAEGGEGICLEVEAEAGGGTAADAIGVVRMVGGVGRGVLRAAGVAVGTEELGTGVGAGAELFAGSLGGEASWVDLAGASPPVLGVPFRCPKTLCGLELCCPLAILFHSGLLSSAPLTSDAAERGAPVGGGEGEVYEEARADGVVENTERADA